MISTTLVCLLLASVPDPAPGLARPGRDPFAGPEQSGSEAPCRGTGLACVSWQRVKVTAVVTAPTGALATLDVGNGESYFAKAGDELRNAVVATIDPQRRGVVLREPVPGTVAGYREIVLLTGATQAVVREPTAAPALPSR